MKITLLPIMTVALLATGLTSFAGDKGCCGASRAKVEQNCEAKYSALNLSDDQKAQIEALKEECEKDGCSKESLAKFQEKMEEILTPEQVAKLKTEQGSKS